MGVHRQYPPKTSPNSSSTRLLRLAIPSTTNFLYDKNDFPYANPPELDLLHTTKAPIMATTTNDNHFINILPSIRRLYIVFNSICRDIYHLHCSDSLRILREIICLTEEYLHIHPPRTISTSELLSNEKYLEHFINKLKHSSSYQIYPNIYSSLTKTEIRCFGQGIHANNYNNELNETLLFCFELTILKEKDFSIPIDVLILDPNENIVSNDIQYINTYHQSSTKLYSCSYKPITQAGNYKISFFYNHIQLLNNPFAVFVRNSNEENIPERKTMDEQEIPPYELEGDGCSTKVIVNSIARFRLRTNSFHKSTIDLFSLSILDPFDHTIVVQRRLLSPDLLELTYQPMSIGEHKLSILFNKKVHRQLIIDVINDETNYFSKSKPFGPGLQRAIVGLPTEFYVDLNQQTITNQNYIQFSLEPSYQAEIDYEQQMATVRYIPLKEGDCPIHILECNKDIPQSPFIANVKQEFVLHEQPRIHVTGLTEKMIIHRPIEFQVSIDNPFDDPIHSLHIEMLTDENSPEVSIHRQDRSSYICSFIPITLGRHLISIDYAGIIAENNPFYCQVIQEKDIQLTGPAINNQCLLLNEPTHFYFTLKDFLTKTSNKPNLTYESGYSSNDETSLNSPLIDGTKEINDEKDNYRVTITDGHGNIKSNVSIKEISENMNDNVRVDFTPDEQILFINISCTW